MMLPVFKYLFFQIWAGLTQQHNSVRERIERKLLTKGGRALHKLRGQIVEPVVGQIKAVRDYVTFMRRGLEAAQNEWRLICATHNLLKLFRDNHVFCASISPGGAG